MTPEAQKAWAAGLGEWRRNLWRPVVSAMTPEQRAEFHQERLSQRCRFVWPADSGPGDHERAAAEAKALEVWAKRLGVAVQIPPVEAFLTEPVRTA